MKRFAGWAVTAGLVLTATAANAQMLAPYRGVSDFDAPYERPYGAVPPAPPPAYNYGARLRAAAGPDAAAGGLCGVARQRFFAARRAASARLRLHRRGDRSERRGRPPRDRRPQRADHPLRARLWSGLWSGLGTGRWSGLGPWSGSPYDESFNAVPVPGYGPQGALPPPTVIRGVPRPPASVPHVASRACRCLRRNRGRGQAAGTGAPAIGRCRSLSQRRRRRRRRSAPPAAQHTDRADECSRGVDAPSNRRRAKPAPVIQPTQPMPAAQGLE